MKAAINEQIEKERQKLKATKKPPDMPPSVRKPLEARQRRLNGLGAKNRPIGRPR